MMSNGFVSIRACATLVAGFCSRVPCVPGRGARLPMPNTVLISEAAIAQRTRELAVEIHRDYAAEGQLHMVCVLKGAFMFLSDLVRAIDMPVTLDFMALSSYANSTTSSGEVRLLKDLDSALEGRHVLIVEDIVDTGLTLHYLQDILAARGPNSVRTACFLSKPSRRQIDVRVEYIGFAIEDHFVVGYGLDYGRAVPQSAIHRGAAGLVRGSQVLSSCGRWALGSGSGSGSESACSALLHLCIVPLALCLAFSLPSSLPPPPSARPPTSAAPPPALSARPASTPSCLPSAPSRARSSSPHRRRA